MFSKWKDRLVRTAIAVAAIASLFSSAAYADPDCNAILQGGTFRTSVKSFSYYSSVVYAAELSQMTSDDARKSLSTAGAFDFDGYTISGNSSDDQLNQFNNSVQQSINVQQVLKYGAQIAVTDGDPTIVKAWSDCIGGYKGLVMTMTEIDPTLISLTVTYQPFPGSPTITVQGSYVEPPGSVVDGQQWLQLNSTGFDPNNARIITIKRAQTAPVYVTINTDRGSASAYLPGHLPPLPHCEFISQRLDSVAPIDLSPPLVNNCVGMTPNTKALISYEATVGVNGSTNPGNWYYIQAKGGPKSGSSNQPTPFNYSFQETVVVPSDGIVPTEIDLIQCQANATSGGARSCWISPQANGQGAVVVVRTLPQ